MAAQDTSGWNEPELRGEIQRLRLREAKAKKKYDQAREEASEKEDEVGRLMEKLQDVMVSLDVSREECEGLRQQGPVETSADVNSAFPSEDELAAVKSTLADRNAELAKAREFRAKAKAKIQDLEGKLAASRAASSANAGGPGASTSGSSEQTDETAVALAKANRINVRAVAKIKDLEASLAASKEAAAVAEARVAAAESASTAGPEDTALVERISELERELDAKTTEMDATVEAAQANARATQETLESKLRDAEGRAGQALSRLAEAEAGAKALEEAAAADSKAAEADLKAAERRASAAEAAASAVPELTAELEQARVAAKNADEKCEWNQKKLRKAIEKGKGIEQERNDLRAKLDDSEAEAAGLKSAVEGARVGALEAEVRRENEGRIRRTRARGCGECGGGGGCQGRGAHGGGGGVEIVGAGGAHSREVASDVTGG